ncbi:MAG TPA: orotidine-5'-phosphate decarboxylase [Jiangellaceae bacterium]|nr:orotidine-5'-phosphate decarboxylase [Jiangellaceae bacterium]
MTFGRRLHVAMRGRGQRCVGVDPHPSLLAAWGLSDDPAGLERFALTAVEALGDQVAVLKPQSAFFERHGSRGVAVLERTVAAARAAGALVLLDVKRGDIGSTVQAYADAYLDPASPLCADAVTASPYLGFESLRPLLDTALAYGRGVFVVTMTSNPEGSEVQQARLPDGRTVAGVMLDHVRKSNAGAAPLGSVGCVIGATTPNTGEDLDVGGPLLVPGIGTQGGTVADLARRFGAVLHRVLPSSSREILSAGPDQNALKAAATRTFGEFTLLSGPESR